jgi:hypothetical protein
LRVEICQRQRVGTVERGELETGKGHRPKVLEPRYGIK